MLKNKIAQLLRDRGVPRGTVIPLDDLMGELSFAYLYMGVSPRILPEILLASNLYYIGQRTMSVAGMRALWLPEFRGVRQTSAFKELIKAAKLDDFWRQMGWPDLCRPRGPEDFVCN